MSRRLSELNQTTYIFVFNCMIKYGKPFSIPEITQQICNEYVFCDFAKLSKIVSDISQDLLEKGIVQITPDVRYQVKLSLFT